MTYTRFAIDPATFAAVLAMSSRIVDVSAERIGQEMERLLSEGGQVVGLDLLARTGLLPHVVPELADMALVPGPAAMDVDDFPAALTAAIARMRGLQRCEPSLGWALLLWDKRAAVEDIARRLRMSRAMTTAIAEIIDAGHTIARWTELRVSEQKRTLRLTHAAQALTAARQSGHREASEAARAALTGWPEEALKPAPLINGRDLTALGYRPGPGFAVALTVVEDAQLEGRVADREAALALAVTVLTA